MQFDENHDGAIPLGELRTMLSRVSDSSIPPDVLDEITWRADRDGNGVLDFQEFMDLVQCHELGVLKPSLHRVFKAAAFTVVPRSERAAVIRSGLEEYNCCPPPLLMPILSLIEVCIYHSQTYQNKNILLKVILHTYCSLVFSFIMLLKWEV